LAKKRGDKPKKSDFRRQNERHKLPERKKGAGRNYSWKKGPEWKSRKKYLLPGRLEM